MVLQKPGEVRSCRPYCHREFFRRYLTAIRAARRSNSCRHGDPLPASDTGSESDRSSATLLAEPDEYDGGELAVEDTYGRYHSVKLPAGHMILYPSTSLHRVNPVTRGARIASFFWIQSMIRDDGQRTILFDLDTASPELNVVNPNEASPFSSPACITIYCANGLTCRNDRRSPVTIRPEPSFEICRGAILLETMRLVSLLRARPCSQWV